MQTKKIYSVFILSILILISKQVKKDINNEKQSPIENINCLKVQPEIKNRIHKGLTIVKDIKKFKIIHSKKMPKQDNPNLIIEDNPNLIIEGNKIKIDENINFSDLENLIILKDEPIISTKAPKMIKDIPDIEIDCLCGPQAKIENKEFS